MNYRFVRAFLFSTAASGGIAFVAQGCTVSSSPVDITSDAGGDGGQPAASFASAVCSECAYSLCDSIFAQCAGDPECGAIHNCAKKATCASNNACVDACYDAHPTGQARYNALVACNGQAICNECSSRCVAEKLVYDRPGVQGATTCAEDFPAPTFPVVLDASTPVDAGPAANPCAACTAVQCPNESGSCVTGSDCDKYQACLLAGTDEATCASQFAAGKAATEALGTCIVGKCTTECASGLRPH